jgi:hypothetical protein
MDYAFAQSSRPFSIELAGLFFHSVFQRVFLSDALFGRVFAVFFGKFHRARMPVIWDVDQHESNAAGFDELSMSDG